MQLMGIHPDYPVTVTPSHGPWHASFVGQPLFRSNGNIYGGTLCRVIADGGDPADSDSAAHKLADSHSTKSGKVFPPIADPLP